MSSKLCRSPPNQNHVLTHVAVEAVPKNWPQDSIELVLVGTPNATPLRAPPPDSYSNSVDQQSQYTADQLAAQAQTHATRLEAQRQCQEAQQQDFQTKGQTLASIMKSPSQPSKSNSPAAQKYSGCGDDSDAKGCAKDPNIRRSGRSHSQRRRSGAAGGRGVYTRENSAHGLQRGGGRGQARFGGPQPRVRVYTPGAREQVVEAWTRLVTGARAAWTTARTLVAALRRRPHGMHSQKSRTENRARKALRTITFIMGGSVCILINN